MWTVLFHPLPYISKCSNFIYYTNSIRSNNYKRAALSLMYPVFSHESKSGIATLSVSLCLDAFTKLFTTFELLSLFNFFYHFLNNLNLENIIIQHWIKFSWKFQRNSKDNPSNYQDTDLFWKWCQNFNKKLKHWMSSVWTDPKKFSHSCVQCWSYCLWRM